MATLREMFEKIESWELPINKPTFLGTREEYLSFMAGVFLWNCEEESDFWLRWLDWLFMCLQYAVDYGSESEWETRHWKILREPVTAVEFTWKVEF